MARLDADQKGMHRLIAISTLVAALLLGTSSLAMAAGSGKALSHHAAKSTVRHTRCQTKRHGTKQVRRCVSHPRHVAHLGRRAVAAGVAPSSPLGSAPVANCDLYASPSGSDAAAGTAAAPFASLQKLDRALAPGQTGCLKGGTYGGLTTHDDLATNGTSSAPITITSSPGETATVAGWVDLEGSYTTLENLRIDGSNTLYPSHPSGVNCRDHVSQALDIAGHNDTLQYDNYFQSVPALRGNAIGVGFWGNADNTTIRFDRIHDVGGCDFYDHLIYLAGGHNARIYDNWMWNDSHGWGVKLDPGPSGARIWGNVIDRAGSGFMFSNSSGKRPTADNVVYDNIVMNSVGVSNPDIHWSHPGVFATADGMLSSSKGNRVYDNDSYANRGGMTEFAGIGSSQVSLSSNTTSAPRFADAAAHDYAVVGSTFPQMHSLIRR